MMRIVNTLLIAAIVWVVAACDSTPDKVLPPDDMASLMADMYVAESVTDVNRSQFYTGGDDSLRKVLKQSVLARHGVTQEVLDSSFMYYGRNLDKYVEVHDRIIAILEERMSHADAAMARAGASQAGDSVNTWPGAPQMVISRRSPSQTLMFSLTPDDNWQKGDYYQWSIKTLNMRMPSQWTLAVDYPGGITECINGQFQGEGLNQLKLYTDSTRIPSRVYGSLITNPAEGEVIYLDSITLTRKRVDRENYRMRHRQQRISTARQAQEQVSQPAPAPIDNTPVNDEPPVRGDAIVTTPGQHQKLKSHNAAALAQ